MRSSFTYTALNNYSLYFHFTCRSPLSISCRAGLVVMNSLTLSEHDLIPPSNWKTMLPDKRFLMDSIYSFIWIYFPTAFWPPWFLMRNLLIIILKIPYLWFSSPCYFYDFSLCLAFQSLIMCLGVDLWVPLTWSGCLYACFPSKILTFSAILSYVSNFLIYKKMQQILKWHKI